MMKKRKTEAVSAHHQKQIDRIQKQCLEVKHETDRTILKLKNVEKETARLEKLVSSYHKTIGGTSCEYILRSIHPYTHTHTQVRQH
jgi:hypothetical protein